MNRTEKARFLRLLDTTIQRARADAPHYTPPPFSPEKLIQLVESELPDMAPEWRFAILEKLRASLNGKQAYQATWEDVWLMLNCMREYKPEYLYVEAPSCPECDEWGYEPEFLARIKPVMDFFYKYYWRVEVTGLHNVPDEGRALLVSNHSGQFPFDGFMIAESILNGHPARRMIRGLYAQWFRSLPYLSTFLTRLGQVLANEENAVRLLEDEQLVAVFPEGYRGISKATKYRYRLKRFGRGGYVRIALRTGAPMIPVSVVGAEEMYMTLMEGAWWEKIFGYPMPPITLTWPWLGFLGLMPLPTKWYIDFGEPISVEAYGHEQADNAYLVAQLNDQVRNTVQQMLYHRLAQRPGIFV